MSVNVNGINANLGDDDVIAEPHSNNAKMLARILKQLQSGAAGGSGSGGGQITDEDLATDDDIDSLFEKGSDQG